MAMMLYRTASATAARIMLEEGENVERQNLVSDAEICKASTPRLFLPKMNSARLPVSNASIVFSHVNNAQFPLRITTAPSCSLEACRGRGYGQ